MSGFPGLEARYPRAALDERARVADDGTFRERVRYDLVQRPQHACGLLAAADVATFSGVDHFTAIEFGVAEGEGLRNLADVAAEVTRETGIGISIVGFDTGEGLPLPEDHRDHPEIWSQGDFSMVDPDRLAAELPDDARLVLGPVAETVPGYVAAGQEHPVGFVSLDLDYHSSTRDALVLFDALPEALLPVTVCYFDDVSGGIRRIGSLFRTEAAGQLRAIADFNDGRDVRRIDPIRILRHRRPLDREPWLDKMYGLHVLDHPARSVGESRASLSMREHGRVDRFAWPL